MFGYRKSEYEGSSIGNWVIHHSNVLETFLHYYHHKFIHLQIKQGLYWKYYFIKQNVFNSTSIYLRIIRNALSRNGQILNQNLLLKGRSFNMEGSAYVLNVLISQDIKRNTDSYIKMSLTISTSLALQSLTALYNIFNTEIKYSPDKTKDDYAFAKLNSIN